MSWRNPRVIEGKAFSFTAAETRAIKAALTAEGLSKPARVAAVMRSIRRIVARYGNELAAGFEESPAPKRTLRAELSKIEKCAAAARRANEALASKLSAISAEASGRLALDNATLDLIPDAATVAFGLERAAQAIRQAIEAERRPGGPVKHHAARLLAARTELRLAQEGIRNVRGTGSDPGPVARIVRVVGEIAARRFGGHFDTGVAYLRAPRPAPSHLRT